VTFTAPPLPQTPFGRLRWAVNDAWVLTHRAMLHWARQPGQFAVGLLFPVMTLLMFAYLFGGGMAVPGGGSYREVLVAGMFALAMVFGLEATFTAVATDAGKGITDRFRSLPMAPSAALVGRSLADMLHSLLGLTVLVIAGLAIGWRWRHGADQALLAIGLLLLLRFAFLWVGIFLGLLTQSPEAVVAVQILVWPLGFLSNAFAAPATMPGPLRVIAEWNPLSATVAATRELFGNPGWGGDSWIAQHSLLMAVVWPLLILALFFPLSIWRYQRLSR
jgi:ABC-type polysaccharide/polyol phosphate export permease